MAEGRAEYRLTPAAQRDLEDIWSHTASTWGIEQAHLYADVLASALMTLARSPLIGPACDHIRTGYRRGRAGRHMIYYRSASYGIEVARILHDRMEPLRRF